MKSIDEQIVDIENLDKLRRNARTLRQEAIEALTAADYVPRPREGTFDEASAARDQWELPGDDVEKAEMLRVLGAFKPARDGSEGRRVKSRDALIRDLNSITYDDSIANKSPGEKQALDDVPVFRCALILQSLAETPGCALGKAALVCLYQVIRELSEVAGPAWMMGAARADDKALATAFVTGECARALLALERALLQTAEAAELLGKEAARSSLRAVPLEAWNKQEEHFRKCSLDISLATLPYIIITRTAPAAPPAPEASSKTAKELLDAIAAAIRAVPKIDQLDLPQDPSSGVNPLARAAKDIAWNAIKDLLQALTTAVSGPAPDLGKSIAREFKRAAQILRDLLRPVEQFAESVIDRQIAAASPQLQVSVDGAELVFAATLLGLVSDWKRPKVRAAYEILHPLLSANGRLLTIRPFDVDPKGYRLNVATMEVTRRFADLVANLDVEPQPDFVERLMLPFDYTRATGAEKHERGWTTDPPPREPKSLWWLTTIALNALDSIVRMLDETINRRVLREFQVRQPETLKLRLDDLFYPDYGFATHAGHDSIAVTLQKLRAHGTFGPPESKPLYSLILYGPPGTGKTTLVEAIAKTAGVPLVEITPSDIMVGGAENVERRARQVFQALTKLTHVVILFDEFDSILLDRAKRDPEEIPTSIIEFLTPGMLPKLKALNDASKEGRLCYVLATNFIDRLDNAVKRGGRFDLHCGIFPPDAISRAGRLFDLLRKQNGAFQEPRVMNVVARTRGAPMDKLGQPGWYSMPRNARHFERTPFGYILGGEDYEDVEREADYEDDKKKYDQQRTARAGKKGIELAEEESKYWDGWQQIEKWDEAVDEMKKDADWPKIYGKMDALVKRSGS